MGKLTINGPFSLAVLVYQRVAFSKLFQWQKPPEKDQVATRWPPGGHQVATRWLSWPPDLPSPGVNRAHLARARRWQAMDVGGWWLGVTPMDFQSMGIFWMGDINGDIWWYMVIYIVSICWYLSGGYVNFFTILWVFDGTVEYGDESKRTSKRVKRARLWDTLLGGST